jgi:hypothetical protein
MLGHMLHNGTHAYHVSQTHTQESLSLSPDFLSVSVVCCCSPFYFIFSLFNPRGLSV